MTVCALVKLNFGLIAKLNRTLDLRSVFFGFALSLSLVYPVGAAGKSEREHQRLQGAVKAIVVEEASLSYKSGKFVEGKRKLDRTTNFGRDGNLTKEVIYASNPGVSTITYRYDAMGNRSDSIYNEGVFSRPPTGEDDWNDIRQVRLIRWRFQYDAHNNRTEELAYSTEARGPISGEMLIQRYAHNYDVEGNRETTSYYDPAVLRNKWVYFYDNRGNAIGQSRYSAGGHLELREVYSCEFDSSGNWIKRTISRERIKDDKPCLEPERVIHRTISYY